MLEKLLNGILKGQNSVEEIVEAVKKMPKHRREMWHKIGCKYGRRVVQLN